ncbi:MULTISPECIES: OmpA family protein [unclassified Lentimicrobium]|uniref:OmpA family protein n=1 Tax=unclassified Lentimicrobium TaxID=2677434 RepID=UPI00155287A9|nr:MULTISPECIES: OmpA family protein [unclassified Lentimicrobium]NPD45206.1 OmpA family protein [Lentimicrobium sp. S6]NPD86576.1 OmpA family protein [Lentimicrobium sp. L6]
MRIKSIFLVFIILMAGFSFGQKLNTKSGKAKKMFEEANYHVSYGQYYEAEEKLEKAIKADPNFCEAYLMMGDIHADLREFERAIFYYQKSVEISPDFYPQAYYFLGKLLIHSGKYEEAEKALTKYLSYKEIDDYSKSDSERNILNCQFATIALQNPVEFEPMNMGQNINSIYAEYFPTMTVDGKVLLYTRRLGAAGQHQQEDFYISMKRKDGSWYASQNMGKSINTQMNEGAATISADGNTLIFTACEQNGNYGYGRNGYGSCDLFFTLKRGDKWTQAVNLGPPINSGSWESQPSLSADGETLYFVRGINRGTRRESDIMVSNLGEDGYWTKPQKISGNINTAEPEESVFIHPDNKTLYFSSKGHLGMGGSDIYMSRKNEQNEWGEPINLGYPINTYSDENSLLVGPDGKIGYFASDRDGGLGELDIYAFIMPKEIQADPVTYFKGVVYDSLTGELLSSLIELIDLETGKMIQNTYSNSLGEFFMPLTPHHNYMVNVSKDGYLFYSDAIYIKENYDRLKPFIKDIPLLPIQMGSSIVLKNIFFELDKSTLKMESYSELNKLYEFLYKNESINIEIGGHTDNQGSDDYNKNLSEHRAQAVYDFLVEKGISRSRLSYKGYSFDKPIDTNDTEEGRANNRRTEFIVVSQ